MEFILMGIAFMSEVEIVTCGSSYKFTILNQSIIRSLWEIGNNAILENPISIRLTGLEIGLSGLPQDKILILGDLKLHRYDRFNIDLLQREKVCIF